MFPALASWPGFSRDPLGGPVCRSRCKHFNGLVSEQGGRHGPLSGLGELGLLPFTLAAAERWCHQGTRQALAGNHAWLPRCALPALPLGCNRAARQFIPCQLLALIRQPVPSAM